MELPNVLRSLEEVNRQIAAYDKDIQDIAELALLRMTNMWGNTEMLKEFRDVVKLRRDAMLRRDALVRLGTAACSSGTLARDAEAERQAKEEAEQKAKAEAERKDNEEAKAQKAPAKVNWARKRPRMSGRDNRNEVDSNE